jgi:hypothetical protein
MQRRLMVIPLDRTFTEEEKDPDLFDRIWEEELPGVLNQALAGYRRLLKRVEPGLNVQRPSRKPLHAGSSRRTRYRPSSKPNA